MVWLGAFSLFLSVAWSAVSTRFVNVCVFPIYKELIGAGILCVCVHACMCMLLPARVCEKHNTCAGVCLELILVSVCDCVCVCVWVPVLIKSAPPVFEPIQTFLE